MEFTPSQRRVVLLAACLAAFVSPLSGAAITLSVDTIGLELGCSEQQLAWLTGMYFVFTVPMMIPAAKLADIYGKKRVFVVGALIGAGALILTSAVHTPLEFYICRAFTAAGAACITGTSASIIVGVFPEEYKNSALAYFVMCTFVGDTVGPSFGGFISSEFSWRGNFVAIAAFFLVAAVLMVKLPHPMIKDGNERFEYRGAFVFGAGSVVTMIGVLLLPKAIGLPMILAGLLILAAFVRMERGTPDPILNLSLFRNSGFSKSIVLHLLSYIASYSILFFMSQYLLHIGKISLADAGLILMVQPIALATVTFVCGKLMNKIKPRILATCGLFVLTFAYVLLILFVDSGISVFVICVAQVISGIGLGLFIAPNLSATMACVEEKDYNGASAIYSMSRHMGITLSMGVASCLIGIFLGTADYIDTDAECETLKTVIKYAWNVCIACCIAGALLSWSRGKNTSAAED